MYNIIIHIINNIIVQQYYCAIVAQHCGIFTRRSGQIGPSCGLDPDMT